jgi:hypothetical protein
MAARQLTNFEDVAAMRRFPHPGLSNRRGKVFRASGAWSRPNAILQFDLKTTKLTRSHSLDDETKREEQQE